MLTTLETRLVDTESPSRRAGWQTSRRSGTLATRLQEQWERIASDPAAVAVSRTWSLGDAGIEAVRGLDDVLVLVGFHRCSDDASDQRLLELVRIAATDDLAGRVVLQRILPGLLAIASRRGRMAPGGVHECFSELASVAWLLIRSYPCDRRPARVAANLLRDAEYEAFVRVSRRLATQREEFPTVLPDRAVPEDDHCVPVVVEVLRLGRESGMPAHDLRLLAELVSGRRPEEIAASLGCTARTIRNRRRDLVVALRAALAGAEVSWPACRPHFYDAWEVAARWAAIQAHAGRTSALRQSA